MISRGIEALSTINPISPVAQSSNKQNNRKSELRIWVSITGFCSKHRTFRTILCTLLFIIISMIVGILVVCFTAPKRKDHQCVIVVERISHIARANNSHPKSLVIHDFNNDSILDIVVANSGTDNIGVFLGKDSGNFSKQITYSTGTDSQPSSVAFADFNRDFNSDIVVANYGTHTIGILFGNGDGTFTNQTTFDTGVAHPLWVTVGDFDNDSRSDVVIVNYGTNTLDILLEYDDHYFTKYTNLSTGYDSIPLSAVVNDFTNDGCVDICVANSGTHTISVFVGDGNGTFPIQMLSFTGVESHPCAISAADLNNDNILDLVVANSVMDHISILYGYGDGEFLVEGVYSTGANSNPTSVIIGDFDNDNQLDIVVSNFGTDDIQIFFNQNFNTQQVYSTGPGSNPYFVASGDINNDGRSDIIAAVYETNTVDILLTIVNISLSPEIINRVVASYSRPIAIGIGDFNNDALNDMVAIYKDNNNIGLSLGNGDGTFSDEWTYSTDNGTYPLSIDVGDFNNDYLLDIVVGCSTDYSGQIQIFFGANNANFSCIITTNVGIASYPIAIVAADFNNDHRLDIIIISYAFLNTNHGTIGVLLGNGDGTFLDHMTFRFHSSLYPQSIAVGDFNNDDRLDFAIANQLNDTSLSSSVGIFLGDGNGSFSNQRTFSTGYYSLTQSITVADLNNDDRLDIIVSNPWNDNIGVLLGYGNGSFSSQKTQSTGILSNPVSVCVLDFDHDAQLDILAVNKGTDSLIVFLGNGNGSFSDKLSYSTGNGSLPLFVALANFNTDSLKDVAIINSGYGNIGVILSETNIYFSKQDPLHLASSPGPHYVVVNDFNNDHQFDIVVANYLTNSIDVFARNGPLNYSLQAEYSTGPFSFPTSLAVADFNNDTLLDIAIANAGIDSVEILFGSKNGSFQNQTTHLIADRSNPQSVAVGDFNNDSRPDILVANSGNNNINVLINSYGGSFTTELSYSTGYGSNPSALAVGDINHDQRLDLVVVNNYYGNLQFFFGDGHGRFPDQTTYLLGDESYPVGVALADFNNDTYLDLVVVRNVVHLIVILLQNDNGSFVNVDCHDTGDDSWPIVVVVDDYNDDRRLDIAVGNSETNNVLIYLGRGNGSFIYDGQYQTGDGPGLASIAVADVDNNDRVDIVISNTWNDYVGILLGNGDGTFSQQIIYSLPTNSFPSGISVGDLDNDDYVDIIVANQGGDNIIILYGYGNGSIFDEVILSTGVGSQPISLVVGDFNNDHRVDIGVANSQSGSVYIFIGYVNRTFFDAVILVTDDRFSLPCSIVSGHFNDDDLLDVTVCNQYSEHISIYLGVAENTFLSMSPYSTGTDSHPSYVVVNDFNDDRILDVVVANYGTDNIMIVYGCGYGVFSEERIYSTGNGSQPRWIAVGDLNNDSVVDIVVANSGHGNIGIFVGYSNGTYSNQMTYSTGVESVPSSIVLGQYNNNTLLDIAVANYGSNSILFYFDYENGHFSSKISFLFGFGSRPLALATAIVDNVNISNVIVANAGYGNIEMILKLC